MFSDLEEVASLLDDCIEKAFAKKGKVQKYEDSIIKGLSHDPFNPVMMTEEQPYYNPYRQMQDGSFLPHSVEYWESQGKSSDDYNTTRQFYQNYIPVSQARDRLETFSRSLSNDLFKAGAVPVGTVHTYRDGHKYKKMGEGQWAPVGDPSERMSTWLNHSKPEYRQQANQEIERHGTQVTALEEMIKRKQSEQQTQERVKQEMTKEIMGKVKDAMSKLYDGKMPDEVSQHFDKNEAKEDGKIKPEDALKDLESKLSQNYTPKHDVTVSFIHNGKRYEHVFPNIQAKGHHDAIDKVQGAISQKLKGAQVTGIQASRSKEDKGSKEGQPQPKAAKENNQGASNG